MRSKVFLLAALLTVGSIAVPARADVDAVNKYLGEATDLVDKGASFFNDAAGKIELAQSSMDDVPAAEKAPLQAKIDALKAKIDSAANDQDAKILTEKLKRAMGDAEGSIGNLVTWKGAAGQVTEILDDPKTTKLLGADAVAKAKKEFAGFQKLNGGKALKANLEVATTQVGELEKDWADSKASMAAADASASDRSRGIENTSHGLEQIERFFTDLPADNADVKALRARVDKVKSDLTAAEGNAGASAVVEYINRFLDSYTNEFAEMDKETTIPTWDQYKSNRSLGCASSAAFVSRVGGFLADLSKDEHYQAAKDAPPVKAKIGELTAKVDTARAKVKKTLETLVDGLEKEKVNKNNLSDSQLLDSEVKNSLGTDSPEGKTLASRIEKLQTDFTNAGDKADADRMAYYKTMSDQATKAWPAMMAKFDVAEGFDPNNASAMKGKYIKLTSRNLMGWRYKSSDFAYATTVNGVAVAGTYDPTVKAALAEVEGKLERGIGDSDSDGDWTAIARVEGGTGRLVQIVQHEGDVSVDGSKVGTVTGTEERSVDAPIVTIVALKAGPVAAAAGQGTVKADGSIGAAAPLAMAGAAGHRGISLFGILMGLIATAVGAACLMKAKFAPLATNAGAMHFTEKVGGQNLEYLGLAGIALGAIGVLFNLIALPGNFLHALIGLAASLAMVIAGGVASRGFFEKRGILPANVGPILTQYAIPAGLASAALGVLTILFSLV